MIRWKVTPFWLKNGHKLMDETTAPSTAAACGIAIGPERHVIAEGYRLVM